MARRQRRRRQRRRQEDAQKRGLRLRKSVITGAGISAGAALGLASTASAASFAVDRMADTAPAVGECTSPSLIDCSLRQAIDAANNNTNPTEIDDITFNSGITGTITVGSELLVSQPVYINGPGANALTISGDDASRIFNIDMAGPNTLPVGIYRLTLTHGSAPSGGAILDTDAVLKVNESVLSGNHASSFGGAIFENGSDAAGGTNNVIYADTITGNTAGQTGGGIYGFGSIGTLATSTVTGNQITGSGPGYYRGAGVYSYSRGYVVDSTIAGNSGAQQGGGVGSRIGMGIYSSILADNSAVSFPDLFNYGGALNAGFSLIENGQAVTTYGGPNITGQDPQLGPLQNNGGGTPTMQPSGGSPVIDQGHSRFARDQRLEPRMIDNPTIANAPGGNAADIGALELPYVAPAVAPPTPTPPTKKKKCKKHKKRAASAKKCKKKKK
jgi:hypothetical protein